MRATQFIGYLNMPKAPTVEEEAELTHFKLNERRKRIRYQYRLEQRKQERTLAKPQ